MAGMPEAPKVRPEGSEAVTPPSSAGARRGHGGLVVVAAAAALGVGLGFELAGSTSPPTTLEAPPSTLTSGMVPSLLPPAPVAMAVQTASRLWELDRHGAELGQWLGVEDSAAGAAEGVLAGRRPGEVFDELPGGTGQTLRLDDQLLPDGVAPNPMMAAAGPGVVVPTRSGDGGVGEVVLALRSFDASRSLDIDLPDCGIPYPFATRRSGSTFGVWCTASGELRIYQGASAALALSVEGLAPAESPAIAVGSGRAVVVAADGSFWMVDLDPPALTEGSLAPLAPGEDAAVIAALSPDGGTLYVGLATAADLASGRRQASRLVVFRLPGGPRAELDLPVAAESIATTSDGSLYAYYPGAVGDGFHTDSELFTIDPDTGSTTTVVKPLGLGDGRLLAVGG